jgi:hypothetical protein
MRFLFTQVSPEAAASPVAPRAGIAKVPRWGQLPCGQLSLDAAYLHERAAGLTKAVAAPASTPSPYGCSRRATARKPAASLPDRYPLAPTLIQTALSSLHAGRRTWQRSSPIPLRSWWGLAFGLAPTLLQKARSTTHGVAHRFEWGAEARPLAPAA